MLKQVPFYFLVCFLYYSCNQKEKNQNSLSEVIKIQGAIESQSLDSIHANLKRAERMLSQIKDAPDSLNAENNYLLGLYFRDNDKLDSAAVYFHNATDFVNDSIYSQRQTEYFRSAWNTYSALGLYGDCLTISGKFKSILNPNKQFTSLSWVYYWEKSAYEKMKLYDKALESNEKRIELAKANDTKNLPAALIAKAGLKYEYLNKKKEAFAILDSLVLVHNQLTYNFQRQVFNNYGVYQYLEGDFKEALRLYKKGLAALKKDTETVNYINELAKLYNNIAEVNMDLKQYGLARKYMDSVIGLDVNSIEKRQQRFLLNYELRLATETNKNTKRLFFLLDNLLTHQTNEYNNKFENDLVALTKKTEEQKILIHEKQATEIKNLKLESRLLILVITVGLLGIIGFLIYQRRMVKFEKQNLQNQQRLLRSQMNPHFIFNTLYAIQNKLKKDQKGASDYLLKFSRLLRLVLENSTQNYVLLEKELDALKKYLDLQLVRLPSKFTYNMTLINLNEDDLIFIPPMLLQPFVENSIEHGFSGIDYTGEINLTLALKGKFIACTIEDNGKGYSSIKSEFKNSTSIELISKYLVKATKSKIDIINKGNETENDSGVTIKFLIPYRLTEND